MFTFDNTLSTDLAKVRFEIGDVNSEGHYLEDETINYFLTTSIGQAVVSCLDHIITQLSIPDFKLDWMSVSNAEARKAFENLLKMKSQKYGISSGVSMKSTVSFPHRADSYEYSEEVNSDGLHYDSTEGGL